MQPDHCRLFKFLGYFGTKIFLSSQNVNNTKSYTEYSQYKLINGWAIFVAHCQCPVLLIFNEINQNKIANTPKPNPTKPNIIDSMGANGERNWQSPVSIANNYFQHQLYLSNAIICKNIHLTLIISYIWVRIECQIHWNTPHTQTRPTHTYSAWVKISRFFRPVFKANNLWLHRRILIIKEQMLSSGFRISFLV